MEVRRRTGFGHERPVDIRPCIVDNRYPERGQPLANLRIESGGVPQNRLRFALYELEVGPPEVSSRLSARDCIDPVSKRL